jgi:hypothetical protein
MLRSNNRTLIQVAYKALCIALLIHGLASYVAKAQDPGMNEDTKSNSSQTQHSPTEVLNQTLAPFTEVHSDVENWSPIELAAYSSMKEEADRECKNLETTVYDGEELFSLAQLCAAGQNWTGAYSAAVRYSYGSGAHVTDAFEILLQADIALHNINNVVEDAARLTSRVSFGVESNAILNYVVNSLEILFPNEDLKVALLRQRLLLPVVSGEAASLPYPLAVTETWQTISLLHYEGRFSEEQDQKALLDKAFLDCANSKCRTNDAELEKPRKQFEFLGKQLSSKISFPSPNLNRPSAAGLWIYIGTGAAYKARFEHAITKLYASLGHRYAIHLVQLESAPDASERFTRSSTTSTDVLAQEHDVIRDSLPFFVLVNSAHVIVFAGNGSISWLNPGHQVDVLFSHKN